MKRQTRISVSLAAAIVVAWLCIHVTGIFFWHWTLSNVPIGIAMVLAQTWLSTGLFIIAHDSMHGALAPGHPRLNRAIGATCLTLYACLSYATLLPQHHLHHKETGTAGDPDFHSGDPSLMGWFMQFFRTYYSHGQIARITVMALIYTLLLGAPLGNIVIFWALPTPRCGRTVVRLRHLAAPPGADGTLCRFPSRPQRQGRSGTVATDLLSFWRLSSRASSVSGNPVVGSSRETA